MRSISERDLATVIQLVAARIQTLEQSLEQSEAHLDTLTDDAIEARCDEQERLVSLNKTLQHLREEYEAALKEGFALPGYEQLINKQ